MRRMLSSMSRIMTFCLKKAHLLSGSVQQLLLFWFSKMILNFWSILSWLQSSRDWKSKLSMALTCRVQMKKVRFRMLFREWNSCNITQSLFSFRKVKSGLLMKADFLFCFLILIFVRDLTCFATPVIKIIQPLSYLNSNWKDYNL